MHLNDRIWRFALAFLCSGVVLAQHDEANAAVGARAILSDVRSIAAPGSPGSIAIWGEHAWPLIAAKSDHAPGIVAAAATLGRGRIVALGHSGYFSPESLAAGDTRLFVAHALTWLARRAGVAGRLPRVGLRHVREIDLGDRAQFEFVRLEGAADASTLDQIDILVTSGGDLGVDGMAAVRRLLERGGGLLAAETGWGWQSLHGGAAMTTNELNQVVAPAGLAWTDGFAEPGPDHRFAVAEVPAWLNASRALDLLANPTSPPSESRRSRKSPPPANAGAAATLIAAARAMPADDALLLPAVRTFAARRTTSLIPSAEHPLGPDRALDRALLGFDLARLESRPADQPGAHPAASAFPGAVPNDAPRVTPTLSIDAAVPGWHSLGLYAAPGDVVKMTVVTAASASRSADPAATRSPRFGLRIGCHTDALWQKDSWSRAPAIARHVALHDGTAVLANPFGGLVYVDVPEGASGTFDVTVTGAVESPLFVLAHTDPSEWRRSIRQRPGPWAELATDKVVVSIPSERVREIDDPTAVLRLWDQVLDAAADLAAIPHERQRPERYVTDVQISAGYMHSGYPIMTHLDAAKPIADPALLHAGNWGLFHELGHNHQRPEWTFEGTGEVTNNLFTVYISEVVCGIPTRQTNHAFPDLEKRFAAHRAAGAPFAAWKKDPFLALLMYIQVREAFGWEPFRRVFAEYRTLDRGERPKKDDDKRDQWLVRLSRAVGRNLGPFFVAWGVPVSEHARSEVAQLPAWMPPETLPAESRR